MINAIKTEMALIVLTAMESGVRADCQLFIIINTVGIQYILPPTSAFSTASIFNSTPKLRPGYVTQIINRHINRHCFLRAFYRHKIKEKA